MNYLERMNSVSDYYVIEASKNVDGFVSVIDATKDIAKACLFMVSDLSTYVSGQVLAVDGCTIM